MYYFIMKTFNLTFYLAVFVKHAYQLLLLLDLRFMDFFDMFE